MKLSVQSQTPINLNALFGFSEDDLLVNRSGQITVAQQRPLKQESQAEAIGASIAFPLISIALLAFREEQSGILLILLDSIIIVMIVAIPFLIVKYRRTMREIEEGISRSVLGKVALDSQVVGKLGERSYYLVVEKVRFRVLEKQQLPFVDRNIYWIFYANTFTQSLILSIEVMQA